MFNFRKKKQRIKVFFLCQYIQGYNKISDVVECMKNDTLFDVYVLAIPTNIKLFPKNNEYEFWHSKFGDIVVNSINNNKWFDLKNEKPDYVFIQRPYDNYLPREYQIDTIKNYSKLCYIPYAFELINLRGVAIPEFFVKKISLFFCSQSEEYNYCKNIVDNTNDGIFRKVFDLGYPSLYQIIKNNNAYSAFDFIDKKANFNIIWTPRWTTDDNLCKTSFFDYKDTIVEYIKKQKDINFVFRPHPLMFDNFIDKGIMKRTEVNKFLKEFKNTNMYYDNNSEYCYTFKNSDVLITDFSSIIIEYFLLNKPVILCYLSSNKATVFMKKMMECFYCVKNWKELRRVLENLKKGNDPLRDKRERLLNEFLSSYKDDVSKRIVEEIKKDFMIKNIF